jgi:hypothetical protein
VAKEDIRKAALISLQGRTEISSGSPYHDDQHGLYEGIINKALG